MSTLLLANYKEEQTLFRALLDVNSPTRIVLFRGKAGSGKTMLLRACLEELVGHKPAIHYVPLQFRDEVVSITEVFYRCGDRLGWPRLSRFIEQVASLQEGPHVHVGRNWMLGRNQIDVALNAESPMDREHRLAALTNAWFNDLRDLSEPVLFALDTFEKANTSVRNWVAGPFLARVAQTPQMRILLAGQEVPDAHNIEWGSHCVQRDLFGIREAEHWLPIVEVLRRSLPEENPIMWLSGVCYALEGRPHDIMQVIQSLPLKGIVA